MLVRLTADDVKQRGQGNATALLKEPAELLAACCCCRDAIRFDEGECAAFNYGEVMPSAAPAPEYGDTEADNRRRICVAAMKCFAAHGSSGASLRMVADTAGVSVGLVQHHFGVKSALIAAVDKELVAILAQAAPQTPPTGDTVADLNSRLTTLIAEHPDAVDYLARLLVDGQPSGRQVFDLLLGFGRSQWGQLHSQATLRDDDDGGGGRGQDDDSIWGALSPLIMILGALILRGHINRQLPEPLDSPTQLRAWSAGLDDVIRGARRRYTGAGRVKGLTVGA